MRKGKAAVNFRLLCILRCEEIVELVLGIDHACVCIAKLFRALEKVLLNGIEQLARTPNEFSRKVELLCFSPPGHVDLQQHCLIQDPVGRVRRAAARLS